MTITAHGIFQPSNWPARLLQEGEEESLDKNHANPAWILGCLWLISSHREIKWTNWTQAGQATGNQRRFYLYPSETSLHHNISDQAVALDRWCSKLTAQDSVAKWKVMDLNVIKTNSQSIYCWQKTYPYYLSPLMLSDLNWKLDKLMLGSAFELQLQEGWTY